MSRVLVVTVEPPWPAHHGGRLRVARVAEALSRDLEVAVAYPDHGTAGPAGLAQTPVACRPLSWAPASPLRSRASIRPHLGGHYLLPVMRSLLALSRELRPDALYWSHSYLAAWAPRELRAIPSVVEFANIEGRRLRTLVTSASGMRRAARAVEATKAAVWEPRVARAASVCVALSQQDLQVLRGWGATAVLAPNGVDLVPYRPTGTPWPWRPTTTSRTSSRRGVWSGTSGRWSAALCPVRGLSWRGGVAKRCATSSRRWTA